MIEQFDEIKIISIIIGTAIIALLSFIIGLHYEEMKTWKQNSTEKTSIETPWTVQEPTSEKNITNIPSEENF